MRTMNVDGDGGENCDERSLATEVPVVCMKISEEEGASSKLLSCFTRMDCSR